MPEVEIYKSRLERTVKIQLSSEGRRYSCKDVLDGLLGAGVPHKAIEALGVREAERQVGGYDVYGVVVPNSLQHYCSSVQAKAGVYLCGPHKPQGGGVKVVSSVVVGTLKKILLTKTETLAK